MKTSRQLSSHILNQLLVLTFLIGLVLPSFSQEISIWQLRRVEQSNMQEFIERETKYWSKVAEAAVEKGNLTFWGLWVKQGGFDLPNSPNVLFVNTFKDIDGANMAEIWNPSALFPNVPMNQIETASISETQHIFFVQIDTVIHKQNPNPDEEYNFFRFIFHNTNSPGELIALEHEHWGPFIKRAIDAGQTTQVAWGNGHILAPSGPNMEANTVSFDVFPTMKDALLGGFSGGTNVQFPQEGLAKINELEINRRYNNIYRRIQVVNANPPN